MRRRRVKEIIELRNFSEEENLLKVVLVAQEVDAIFVSRHVIRVYYSRRPFLLIPKGPSEEIIRLLDMNFQKFGKYFYVNPNSIVSQKNGKILLKSGQRIYTSYY